MNNDLQITHAIIHNEVFLFIKIMDEVETESGSLFFLKQDTTDSIFSLVRWPLTKE